MNQIHSPLRVAAFLAVLGSSILASAAGTLVPVPISSTEPGQPDFNFNGRTLGPALMPQGNIQAGDVSFAVAKPVRFSGTNRSAMPLATPAAEFKASELLFLHTFQPGQGIDEWRAAAALAHRKVELPPPPPRVFSYTVQYADGEKLSIPVRFSEGIEQWYRVQSVAPMLWARNAWIKPIDEKAGEFAAVYAMRWPNPRPEKAIARIGIEPAEETYLNYGDALIFGITANPSAPEGPRYYVASPPIGDDSAAGTFDAPWESLGRAVKELQPGATIFVRGGYYTINRPVVIEKSGADGKWCTISAYPGETPVIDAYGVLYDYRKQPYVQNGPKPDPFQHDSGVIHAPGSPKFLRIQGLQVQNSRRALLSAYGKTSDDRGNHVEFFCNTLQRAFSMGIIAHGIDDLQIIGNRVCRPHSALMHSNVQTLEPEAMTEHPQESIDLSRNDRFDVGFNEIYGSNKEAVDAISVRDGRIHHNYIHSSLSGIYIDSWTIPIERVEVDHNFIQNVYNGIPCSTEGSNQLIDFRIHHNIVIDSKSGAIGISEATFKSKPAAVHGHTVFNNTVDGGGRHARAVGWFSAGYHVSGFPQNTEFKDLWLFNNIGTNEAQLAACCSFPDMAARNIVFTNNLFFPADDRVPQWMRERNPTASDKWKLTLGDKAVPKDPLYMNPARGDYRLRQGSPAIGAGVTPGANGAFDAKGKPVDLGALPFGTAWLPGFDWAGHVTSLYAGARVYRPVSISRDKCTMCRDHLRRPSWYQIGRYGVDLQLLPAGDQCFAGINWFIEEDANFSGPNVLALRGHAAEVEAAKIEGIPVGRKAETLCFLHTYHTGPLMADLIKAKQDAGKQLFQYVVHYADGKSVILPVCWRQQIDGWLAPGTSNLPEARLAWTIPAIGSKKATPDAIRLYAFEWKNPEPEKQIASLDLVTDQDPLLGSGAVIAISTGERP